MAYKDGNSNGLLVGALLGAAAVAALAYVVTSKNGQKLKQDLKDGYEDVSNKVEQFIGGLKDTIHTNVSQKMEDISERTKESIGSVKETISSFADLESKDFKQGLLVGGIVGVALSIGGTMVFKASFEEKERFNGMEHLGCKLVKWKNIVKDVMDSVAGDDTGRESSKIHHFPQTNSQTLDEVLDFAATGMKLWNKMKGSR